MKVNLNAGFLDTREIVELAKAADELGYDGIGIPDHVVNLAELDTPYPYTKDGQRRWPPFTDWPDPWVLVGALGACTTRVRFITTVYVAALRSPYSAAKAIGTASVLSQGRLDLGLGVGWCREEFDLLDQPFAQRGKRSEEMVELMRELWTPGWTEFDGEFYSTPKLEMSPTPPPIPIMFGGLTDAALERAARYDGWIGDICSTNEAIDVAGQLHEKRRAAGLPVDDYTVMVALNDAITPDDIARAEAGGVTHIMTQPWWFYDGPDATLDQKIDAMSRYREDFLPR